MGKIGYGCRQKYPYTIEASSGAYPIFNNECERVHGVCWLVSLLKISKKNKRKYKKLLLFLSRLAYFEQMKNWT